MKICFICGSLCRGQDGVGDYTFRLASQLIEDGHECLLLSLNDVVDAEEDHDGLQIIRRKELLARSSAKEEAIDQIIRWRPDWISLQFVCFSFHHKGFIHRLIPFLVSCLPGHKLHIMFHELWVGEQPSLPFKHRIMGIVQQYYILKALRAWRPSVLHTSNMLYKEILHHHGYQASILPLFGNIPIASTEVRPPDVTSTKRTLIFPFSQRHDWNVTETMDRIHALAVKAEVDLKLIQIGKLRPGDQHWDYIRGFCEEHHWPLEMFGPQEEHRISEILRTADIGISSAHIGLAGKSGAVAAMKEHGLPVICTATQAISKRFSPDNSGRPDGIYSLFDDEDRLVDLFRAPERLPARSMLPSVARQMAGDLIT